MTMLSTLLSDFLQGNPRLRALPLIDIVINFCARVSYFTC